MTITEQLAQDFLELHNQDIQEAYNHNPIELVDIALESYPLEDNGMGGYLYEIDSSESKSGLPIIFEFPLNIED